MPEDKSHKATVNRLLEKFRAAPEEKGADIQATNLTVEVESEKTVTGGLRQLQGYRGPVYIAGTNKMAVDEALEATKGTTIGVMDNQGKIIKRSTRKR